MYYFGEGAISEGDFYIALNIAAGKKYPIVFLYYNNSFAISTPISEQYIIRNRIIVRGISYSIESIRVNRTNIFAIYEVTKEARRKALEDRGRPILREFISYRVSYYSTSSNSFV